jgi:putative acetyltransferase
MAELLLPDSADDWTQVRMLMQEYAQGLGVDLCFQDFARELAQLPGAYAAPRGTLRLAKVDGHAAGCCALRPVDTVDYANACEMKRLYLRPQFRGLGLGRQLAQEIMVAARLAGYASVLLDTLDTAESARAMYQDLGFIEIPPHYYNPIAGSHYLKANL